MIDESELMRTVSSVLFRALNLTRSNNVTVPKAPNVRVIESSMVRRDTLVA